MYEWGTRMRLKHYLNQGMTKAELSRQFGISRRTIHYWIETAQFDGIWQRAERSTRHDRDRRTSWIGTRGSSRRGWRSSRSCRRSGYSTKCRRRDTRAATDGYGTTCGRCGRGSRWRRRCASKRHLVGRARWTSERSRCHGAVDMRFLVVLGHSRRSPAARSTRFFTHVVAYHPTARDAHLNLGSELLSRNRLDEALAAYRIAERQRPDDCKPPYGAGLALHHLDRLDEAEAAYFRASELCPRYGAALTDFAKLRLDGGGPPTGGTRPCTPPPPRCWASIDIRSVHEDLRRWVAP